ncbi:MAG: hypothetical protein AAGA03_17320 [Planctomycetota bacterium]
MLKPDHQPDGFGDNSRDDFRIVEQWVRESGTLAKPSPTLRPQVIEAVQVVRQRQDWLRNGLGLALMSLAVSACFAFCSCFFYQLRDSLSESGDELMHRAVQEADRDHSSIDWALADALYQARSGGAVTGNIIEPTGWPQSKAVKSPADGDGQVSRP